MPSVREFARWLRRLVGLLPEIGRSLSTYLRRVPVQMMSTALWTFTIFPERTSSTSDSYVCKLRRLGKS